jgi:hypothetical protein
MLGTGVESETISERSRFGMCGKLGLPSRRVNDEHIHLRNTLLLEVE